VEFSKRDLSVSIPVATPSGVEVRVVDWKEQLGRAYLFWTPHEWLALSTEYQYERFDRLKELNLGLKEATTQNVPLGLRVFHPSGLSLALKGTYITQDGEFQRRSVACCEPGASDFWVVDAAISYCLPKRYGFMTVGATNLLDQTFKYQDTDVFSITADIVLSRTTIQPARTLFAILTLAFP
jgi:hypothetical protein